MELTETDIEAIISNGKDDVHKVLGSDGAIQIRQDTAKNYPQYARLGDRIITNFVQFLRLYK